MPAMCLRNAALTTTDTLLLMKWFSPFNHANTLIIATIINMIIAKYLLVVILVSI